MKRKGKNKSRSQTIALRQRRFKKLLRICEHYKASSSVPRSQGYHASGVGGLNPPLSDCNLVTITNLHYAKD